MYILLASCFCSSSPSIWYVTWPCLEKKKVCPLGTPTLQNPTPGAWHRRHLVCFVSFICENTHKVWYKIFKIVIEIKWYLTLWPLLRNPGGGTKMPLHAHSCELLTHHLVEFRPMVLEEMITDRRTDGRRRLQYPLRLFNKGWGTL